MSKKLKSQIEIFWNQWSDRKYMRSIVYPSIGRYLKNKKTKRVLDIGAEWFNIINKELFFNEEIEYCVMDINKKTRGLKCDKFIRGSILDIISTQKELRSYFDVVISFGVLGWYKFKKEEVRRYLENVSKILKPNGIFLLKLDMHIVQDWEIEFKIPPKLIKEFFTEVHLRGLPKKKILKERNLQFLFLTLKKKNKRSK